MQHRLCVLVLDVNLQHGDSGGIATRLLAVLAAGHDLGGRRQGVADEDRALQHQAAIEEIAKHSLGGGGGLADRQVTHEIRVSEHATATGDRAAQGFGEREAQPVAKQRRVKRRVTRRERDRGSVVEDPADREIFEVGTADRHHRRRGGCF